MKRTLLLTALLAGCGQPQAGSVVLNFPADWVTDGILHAAVFESGRCATLASPVPLEEALVRLSDPSNFNAQNERQMTLSAIPAGRDRMVVAVIEMDGKCVGAPTAGDQRWRAGAGLVLEGCLKEQAAGPRPAVCERDRIRTYDRQPEAEALSG